MEYSVYEIKLRAGADCGGSQLSRVGAVRIRRKPVQRLGALITRVLWFRVVVMAECRYD